MEYLICSWLALAAVSLIVEVVVRKMYAIWATPAALVSALFALCYFAWYWQALVFFAIFALGILGGRKLVLTVVNWNKIEDINDLIGARAIVTEKVDTFAGCGLVKVKGGEWAARGVGDEDVFQVGERLSVVAIEGVCLICRKK